MKISLQGTYSPLFGGSGFRVSASVTATNTSREQQELSAGSAVYEVLGPLGRVLSTHRPKLLLDTCVLEPGQSRAFDEDFVSDAPLDRDRCSIRVTVAGATATCPIKAA